MYTIAVRFDEGVDGEELIRRFLARTSFALRAGMVDDDEKLEAWSFTSVGVISIEGLSSLIMPAIIAALIVLHTMMGSVYERFREIGVYSSVGLAPAHISFLFLAEACVYAVLSVVFGYLLGQGTVKVLRFVFPFTVNETNVDSLCGYLYSQYASYNDESVGGFYTEQTRIVTRQVVIGPL